MAAFRHNLSFKNIIILMILTLFGMVHSAILADAVAAEPQTDSEIAAKKEVERSLLHQVFGKSKRQDLVLIQIPWTVNDEFQGRLTVRIDQDKLMAMSFDDIAPLLEKTIAEDRFYNLKKSVKSVGQVDVETLEEQGIIVDFDADLLIVNLGIDSHIRKTKNTRIDSSPSRFTTREYVTSKGFSGFATIRASSGYSFIGNSKGLMTSAIAMDTALSFRNTTVEGRFAYADSGDMAIKASDLRLVSDFVERSDRLVVGELSQRIQGFQGYQQLLGVTFEKNYSLQPYKRTHPTGNTSFFLEEASEVEIIVNNRVFQTLNLDAGPHNLRNFPVTNGANDVKIRTRNSFGEREELSFSVFSYHSLLEKGLHDYAYNIGFEKKNGAEQLRYNVKNPTFTGFHRVGVTENTTAGANVQINRDAKLLGVEITNVNKWGLFHKEFAFGRGQAIKSIYRFEPESDRFNRSLLIAAEYRNRKFADIYQLENKGGTKWSADLKYSQNVENIFAKKLNFTANFNASYRAKHNGFKRDFSAGVGATKMMLGAQISFDVDYREERKFGAFLSFGIPLGSNHDFSASYDSESKSLATNFSYSPAHRFSKPAIDYQSQKSEDAWFQDIQMNVQNYRGDLGLRHVHAYDFTRERTVVSQSQVDISTSIAFAENKVAISQPIQNSFAIISAHESLKNRIIRINPVSENYEKVHHDAQIDRFGPAVVSKLSNYYFSNVSIDSSNLPMGLDLGKDQYNVFSGYKNGIHIRVGSEPFAILDGYLENEDGDPIALTSAYLESVEDSRNTDVKPSKRLVFFTNKVGRFRINHVTPGEYRLIVNMKKTRFMPIQIKSKKIGYTKIGTITLAHEKDPRIKNNVKKNED